MAQSNAQKKAAAKSRAKQRERAKGPNKVAILQAQNGQLQGALLNIRHMYDQKVLEAQENLAAATRKDQLITALLSEQGTVVVSKEAIQAVLEGQFTGYNVEDEGEAFELTVLVAEEEDDEEVD